MFHSNNNLMDFMFGLNASDTRPVHISDLYRVVAYAVNIFVIYITLIILDYAIYTTWLVPKPLVYKVHYT